MNISPFSMRLAKSSSCVVRGRSQYFRSSSRRNSIADDLHCERPLDAGGLIASCFPTRSVKSFEPSGVESKCCVVMKPHCHLDSTPRDLTHLGYWTFSFDRFPVTNAQHVDPKFR